MQLNRTHGNLPQPTSGERFVAGCLRLERERERERDIREITMLRLQEINRCKKEEEEIFYMFRPDNTSDHMQQGLMTLHHIISLQQ